jgi:ABC-type lipoprotein export system ATPase subunit
MLKYLQGHRPIYGKIGEEWCSSDRLIHLHKVVKVYETAAGDFMALKGIDLTIRAGDFVSIVGKSGSGKSTLINMMTGIDRPTSGEVFIGGVPIHTFNEGTMAKWRGRNLGIVFQFFQLLPMLTSAENVMLPMDFCGLYSDRQRRRRAMELLDMVGVADQADKLPSTLSGGQQQRVAIARALANDPPILMADEPTGTLDSKTSEHVFKVLEDLVRRRKTIVMVTHDSELAKRVNRTITIVDGEIIETALAQAFPLLSETQLIWATSRLQTRVCAPGEILIQEGQPPLRLYIVTSGEVEVVKLRPDGKLMVVSRIGQGNYFGEMGLVMGGTSHATVRCPASREVEVVSLEAADFKRLLDETPSISKEVMAIAGERLRQYEANKTGGPGA